MKKTTNVQGDLTAKIHEAADANCLRSRQGLPAVEARDTGLARGTKQAA